MDEYACEPGGHVLQMGDYPRWLGRVWNHQRRALVAVNDLEKKRLFAGQTKSVA